MARPTEEVVLWAAQDVTLPALEGPNKVLPISDLINKGWDMNQKPAADEFNYLLNNYAKWLIYLDEKSGGASLDAPEVDSLPSTTPLRDTGGKGCFKGIKASNTINANAFNMIDTYNSKTAVSVSIDGNEVGNFVYNGLLASGDGKSGLACNTAGTHYGNVVGDVIGNATSADKALKWTTARTITFTGDVSGSVSLDGSSNKTVTLNVTSGARYVNLYSGLDSSVSINIGVNYGPIYNNSAGILTVYLKNGDEYACGTLQMSFLSVAQTGTLFIDYGDSSDWVLTFNYSSVTGLLVLTSTGRGNIYRVGLDQ